MTAADHISGRSFAAGQDFLLAAKSWWTTDLYPALRASYDARAADLPEPPDTPGAVEALIGDTPMYRCFAWLERHLQRFKYSGRYGLQPWHEQSRGDLEAALDPADLPDGLLTLDPDLPMPKPYTAVDIHQHPGGIWQDDIAGYVYERGARSTTPLAGGRHRDLHDRLTDAVEERAGAPETLLDMGCGFGKSTGPLIDRFRDADITGIDIAAPCLKLAAKDAAEAQARNVHYRQMDCRDTDFEDGSFDVVTSTMLLHEMPPKHIDATFEEAHRLLAPGGKMVHLDFWHLSDAFDRFIHYGHARRNNEPWMPPWAEMDVEALLSDKGFTNIEIVPFEEADGTLSADYANWRFPWTLIAAERA